MGTWKYIEPIPVGPLPQEAYLGGSLKSGRTWGWPAGEWGDPPATNVQPSPRPEALRLPPEQAQVYWDRLLMDGPAPAQRPRRPWRPQSPPHLPPPPPPSTAYSRT
jgi:hypothetical protein